MKTKIIKIGNSLGICIPKAMSEQVQLGDEVELELRKEYLVIKSASSPRQGWENAFANAPTAESVWDDKSSDW